MNDRASRHDHYDLARFLEAQSRNYADAIAELRAGKKTTHWMWYVFPQIAGLGSSDYAIRYAIGSRAEAEAYLVHPVLGGRLRECCDALLAHHGRPARDILGTPDDLKLRSSATLFDAVAPGDVFGAVLELYCGGEKDDATIRLLSGP